ncbi:MAG: hypothetical protein CEN91_328 [Candidatus Berkelbacteria bacterium Licking1014_85]|uniref:Uncharacterized protein n=1 Tax=Candidatus Berkelbacteria bacterium Licking1014_85 TaxID=2017148 RepID=A0A554LJC0_9BACT|nr:MAG: hypothetical protein CEN91_328 [Candidatus Berkelbacteria bacterium Licking1014_85]
MENNSPIYRCSYDNDVLIKNKNYHCMTCLRTWNNFPIDSDVGSSSSSMKNDVTKFVLKNSLLVLVTVVFLSIQFGGLTTFVDANSTNTSLRIISLIIWWLVFLLLFSIPVSFFWQVKIKKNTLARAMRHHWIFAAPLIAIILELINIIIVIPVIKI